MFKQLIIHLLFNFNHFTPNFSHQDNQAEIKQQEAILLASFKNFNPEELLA